MLLVKLSRDCAQVPKCFFLHKDSFKNSRHVRKPVLRALIYSHVRCSSSQPKVKEETEESRHIFDTVREAEDVGASYSVNEENVVHGTEVREEKDSETKESVKEEGKDDKKKFTRDVLFDHYVAKSQKSPSLKQNRTAVDYDKIYKENTFINAGRAMKEYLLTSQDLEDLRTTNVRTAYNRLGDPGEKIYMQLDVEKKSIDKWGSKEALEMELKERLEKMEYKERLHGEYGAKLGPLKKQIKEEGRGATYDSLFGTREEREEKAKRSERVVKWAVAMNLLNTTVKFLAWKYTGSAAMFSETLHSLADTVNQLLLWYGIRQSIKAPSPDHPYGFDNSRYIWALISGCSIFFVGCGVSVYHGVTTINQPASLEHLDLAFGTLLASFSFDFVSMWFALQAVRKTAKETGMTPWEYIKRGRDPNAVAVLLEDSAALLGVLIAAGGIGATYLTGNAVYDGVGSICVGGLLGVVAGFLIQRNATSLMGKSIPEEQVSKIVTVIENDRMVRSIHDVKATEMGANSIRFKAEINFDGREVTRAYLNEGVAAGQLLDEVRGIKTEEELQAFLLGQGELIIDILGRHVDRIEDNVKKKFPEVRHVDLEIL